MAGWIKDYRKEIESDIWLLPPMYHRVWQWIKYSVNHSPNKIPNKDGTFTLIKRGQRATSYRQIAKGVGYYEGLKWKEPNAKTVKCILDWLVASEMIVLEGNSRGTVITVVNWESYQNKDEEGNTQVTPKKHSLDTNKNDKEGLKNDKELKELKKHLSENDSDDISEQKKEAKLKLENDVNEIWRAYPNKKGKADSIKKIPKILKKYSKEQILNSIKVYDQDTRDKKYLMMGSTFFNGRYLDYIDGEVNKYNGVNEESINPEEINVNEIF